MRPPAARAALTVRARAPAVGGTRPVASQRPIATASVPRKEKTGMRAGLTNYGDDEFSLFLRKAFIKGAGYSDDALDRRIVGIINTASDYNPCHANSSQLLDAVRRGVMLSGALPLAAPTISLHESFSHPTSMLLRNLMSMDTEEVLRAAPMDAAVLLGGCDKTVPAQLMGAISADVPVVQLVVGPMVTGSHKGTRVGACTDCRGYWARFRAGEVDAAEIAEVGNELVPSAGTCGVMGTASTMALLTEALGVAPLGSATPPANSSARLRVAEAAGRLAAAGTLQRPSEILSRKSFENAITVLQAIGGSTNAVVHLLAIAGRVRGLNITLDGTSCDTHSQLTPDFDLIGRRTPLLVDLKPSGINYMEDLHKAGGLPALLRELRPLLHLDAKTVTGETLGDALASQPAPFTQDIVRPFASPLVPSSALVVLRGNLAPDGAVLKASAMSPALRRHRGRAVVFKDAADLLSRIDDPAIAATLTPDSVLVCQLLGPVGHPGMPEAGYLPLPGVLARAGVKDMLRISDGRMSGTASGAVVLHVAPESGIGGPLAAVRDGDEIELDVEARSLHLHVPAGEIDRRLAEWNADSKPQSPSRGYARLYADRVNQADRGTDFDFLRADGK